MDQHMKALKESLQQNATSGSMLYEVKNINHAFTNITEFHAIGISARDVQDSTKESL